MAAKIEPEPHAAPPPEEAPQRPGGIHVVSGVTSTAQKLPDKRPLSENELKHARKVFDAGLNYSPVRIERMGSFIEFFNGSRAYTTANSVQLPGKAYSAPHQYLSIIIHELIHVWQYQHGGWGYAPNALWSQFFGDGYDFAKGLREGKPWTKMNPEQQAQMIQDAFRGNWFDTPGARFGVLKNKGAVVRPGTETPAGFTDYTSALEEALVVLRKPS